MDGEAAFTYHIPQSEFGSRSNNVFVIASDAIVSKLLDHIKTSGVKQLGDVFELSRGYIAYDAYRGHSKEMIKARVFHADHKQSDEFKKELLGSDIGRYFLNIKSKFWIRFGDNLAAPRHPRFHTGPRIWIQRIRNPKLTQRLVCFYTDKHEDLVASSGLTICRSISPEYSACGLCGLLNSRLINWWYRQLYHDVNIKPADIQTIPIPVKWLNIQPEMVQLVERMLALHKQLAAAKTAHDKTALQRQIAATDRQIDRLVYQLYNLTEEEIKIVEESGK